VTVTDTPITRRDLDAALTDLKAEIRNDIRTEVGSLRIEWRQEMVTHIRWLTGLFIVQFIATVGATAGIVGWMLNVAIRTLQ
jgi:hypothetical protein